MPVTEAGARMSNTLSLATRLQAMSDVALASVLTARSLNPNGIKDFFDLAEAFLSPVSVQQMLTRLDRQTLAALAAIGELTHDVPENPTVSAADVAALLATRARSAAGPNLAALGTADAHLPEIDTADSALSAVTSVAERTAAATALLLAEENSGRFFIYDTVFQQLRSWPAFGLPSLAELAVADAPAALERVPDVDHRFIDRLGAERAFAATTAITQLLVDIERDPARELAKGGVALPDSKRLANAMAVDLESVAVHITVAAKCGLIVREVGFWMISERGASWLLRSTGERWGDLAASWFDRLPADIRTLLGERTQSLWGAGLRSYIDWLYPAGGDWMDDRVAEYTRDAELLGITANRAPTGPGTLLLAQGTSTAATVAMTALLPAEVEQVYLQHDLSIVAPGPLTPRVDARLRALSDVESRALASSYRVSTSSVNRAMASGETADSMLEFLRSISLTGIPQPLDYLIAETSARYGLVRVGAIENSAGADSGEGALTYIRSDDEHQVGTIMVDQGLSSLGLERTADGRAVSRYPLDVVFWSVSDARYPVAAEDSSGQIISLRRQRTAKLTAVGAADPIAALIERLRLGGAQQEEENGQAWLIRQLDVAIKARASLTVSVSMPNGSIVDYQLDPTSVAGGRLRGRDNRSAIERTLPLSRITSIGPARSGSS